MAQPKTNAVRLVESAKLAHSVHEYENDGNIDGISVAHKLGQPEEKVFKTLVTRSGRDLFVFVLPVAAELDLKKAAKTAGVKSIEMIHVSEINKLTGYIRGGCSPIGMKKLYPTFIDETAQLLDTMIFSAGKIGLQLEMAPDDLAGLVKAKFADLTMA